MKNEKSIKERISQLKKEYEPLEAEYDALTKAFDAVAEAKEAALEKELEKLNEQKKHLPHSKCSLLSPIILIIFIAFAVINLIWINLPFIITLVSVAVGIVLKITLSSIGKKANSIASKPIDEEIEKITEELKETKANMYYLGYVKDPKISPLLTVLEPIRDEIKALEKELADIELSSKIGNNNLFVYADTDNARQISLGATSVSVYMNIDGTNHGMVAKPFSVVHLSEGVHSISFELHFHQAGEILTMKEHQFSLNNNNRFIKVDKIVNGTSSNIGGCHIEKYNDFDEFLKHIKMYRYQAEDYLSSL